MEIADTLYCLWNNDKKISVHVQCRQFIFRILSICHWLNPHIWNPQVQRAGYRVTVTLHNILSPKVWLCSLVNLWGSQGQPYNKYALTEFVQIWEKKEKEKGKSRQEKPHLLWHQELGLGQVRTPKFSTQLLHLHHCNSYGCCQWKDNERVFDPSSIGQKALCNSLPGCFFIYEGGE